MTDSEKLKGCCISCRHVVVERTLMLLKLEGETLYKSEYSCSITLDRVTGEPLLCERVRANLAELAHCGIEGTHWERKE